VHLSFLMESCGTQNTYELYFYLDRAAVSKIAQKHNLWLLLHKKAPPFMSVTSLPLRKPDFPPAIRPDRTVLETPFGRRTRLASIGEMAREFGVTLRTLRFYEIRGLIKPLRQGNQRLYGPQERARLQLILSAKDLGFTLTEITSMLETGNGEPALRLDPSMILRQIEFLENQHRSIEQALGGLRHRYYMMNEEQAASAASP
jgi:DNA-binding transcriptional MerR regulator